MYGIRKGSVFYRSAFNNYGILDDTRERLQKIHKKKNEANKLGKEISESYINIMEDEELHKFLSNIERGKISLKNIDNDDLKNDRELMLLVMKIRPSQYVYMGDTIKDDKNFFYEMLVEDKYNVTNIVHSSDNLQNDKDLMLDCLYISKFAGRGIGDELLRNEDFKKVIANAYLKNLIRNIKQSTMSLEKIEQYFGCSIKDKINELINTPDFYKEYLSVRRLESNNSFNEKFLREAILENNYKSDFSNDEITFFTREFTKNKMSLNDFFDEKLLNDETLIKSIVAINPKELQFVGKDLKDNLDFNIECLQQNSECFQYVGNEIKENETFKKILVSSYINNYFMKNNWNDFVDRDKLFEDLMKNNKCFDLLKKSWETMDASTKKDFFNEAIALEKEKTNSIELS